MSRIHWSPTSGGSLSRITIAPKTADLDAKLIQANRELQNHYPELEFEFFPEDDLPSWNLSEDLDPNNVVILNGAVENIEHSDTEIDHVTTVTELILGKHLEGYTLIYPGPYRHFENGVPGIGFLQPC